jgi:hypothetical protein
MLPKYNTVNTLYEGKFVTSKAVLQLLRRIAFVVFENGKYAK